MVYGVERGREIREGEGCDRPFSHIKEIVLNIKEGHIFNLFTRMYLFVF